MIGNGAEEVAGTEGVYDLLIRKEASVFLAQMGMRLKPATLARIWSVRGDGPPCRHIRSGPCYPRGLLREWAVSHISEVAGAPCSGEGSTPYLSPWRSLWWGSVDGGAS